MQNTGQINGRILLIEARGEFAIAAWANDHRINWERCEALSTLSRTNQRRNMVAFVTQSSEQMSADESAAACDQQSFAGHGRSNPRRRSGQRLESLRGLLTYRLTG